MESDDVWMGRESLERLYFSQIVNLAYAINNSIELTYLVDVIEVSLHALDGHILACFDRLRLQHFRKGAFSFFANQSVLYS